MNDLDIVKSYKRIYKENFINACIRLQKNGYTKEEISELSGMSRTTITNWMKEYGFTATKQDTSKRRGYYKKNSGRR